MTKSGPILIASAAIAASMTSRVIYGWQGMPTFGLALSETVHIGIFVVLVEIWRQVRK